jgi:hypothetical protein
MLDFSHTVDQILTVVSVIAITLNELNIRRSLHRRGIAAELRNRIDRMFAELSLPSRKQDDGAAFDQA